MTPPILIVEVVVDVAKGTSDGSPGVQVAVVTVLAFVESGTRR